MDENETNEEALGKVAYEAYCDQSGGKSAITGADLPTWDNQADGVKACWMAAARAVKAQVDAETDEDELAQS